MSPNPTMWARAHPLLTLDGSLYPWSPGLTGCKRLTWAVGKARSWTFNGDVSRTLRCPGGLSFESPRRSEAEESP